MQTSEMQSLIDWYAIMPMARFSGGHDRQMKALFKGALVLAHWNEGDYQGCVATAVALADGRYCWYQDSYGSCRGCDVWEDASDIDARKRCIDLANSARVFPSLALLREDLMEVSKNLGMGIWYAKSAAALLSLLPDPITPLNEI